MTHIPTTYRLTPEDEQRVRDAVDAHYTAVCDEAGSTDGSGVRVDFDQAERIACHAIGCAVHDLRPIELDWIAQTIGARAYAGPYMLGPADPAANRTGPHYRDAVRELRRRWNDEPAHPVADHNHRDRIERIGSCPACQHNAAALSRYLRRRHHVA